MFTSIVVAVDGSEHASKALQVSAELAARDDVPLGIVYVVDSAHMAIPDDLRRMAEIEHINEPTPRNMTSLDHAPESLVKTIADSAADNQRALYQLAEFIVKQAEHDAKMLGATKIRGSVQLGSPAQAILDFAKRENADLIVTGCRGFGPIKSMLLGSTSHKVAQLANCSCMTVK